MPEREPQTLLNPGRTPLIAGLLTTPLVAAGDALIDASQAVLAPFRRDPAFDPLTDADPDHQWSITGVSDGNDGYFIIAGDHTSEIYPGFVINVSDATILGTETNRFHGNNGYYVVKAVTLSGSDTRVGVQFIPEDVADGTLTLIVPHHALTDGLRLFVNRDTSASAPANTFAIIAWIQELAEYHWIVLGCGANPS